jgi:uncharacterized protein (DUF2147 family)
MTIAAATLIAMAGAAYADPIEGNWRTDSGETVAIAGGGSFTITVKTGKHAGKRIGTFNADGGGKYSGQITDPKTDKTYTGKASLSGNALKMSGCVFGGLICQSQNWKRQ